jgi:hypothetical protein
MKCLATRCFFCVFANVRLVSLPAIVHDSVEYNGFPCQVLTPQKFIHEPRGDLSPAGFLEKARVIRYKKMKLRSTLYPVVRANRFLVYCTWYLGRLARNPSVT